MKEALKLALEALERGETKLRWEAITAIKEALAQPKVCKANQQCVIGLPCVCQPEERNFCPRCGKRTADLTTIHTCTPPQEIA